MRDDVECQQSVADLLALPDAAAQQHWLEQNRLLLRDATCADAIAEALKGQVDHSVRAEIRRAQATADLMRLLAAASGNPLHEALRLRAQGNIHAIGEGRFQEAIECYDAAAAVYRAARRPVDEARSQVGKIACLTRLSRPAEAFALGEWGRRILREHGANRQCIVYIFPTVHGLLDSGLNRQCILYSNGGST